VTKCTTTEAAPWYFASFFRRATGMLARSKVPIPTAITPTDSVSGGSAVGDGVGVATGLGEGVGVVDAAPEQAESSTADKPASQSSGDRNRGIHAILSGVSVPICA
jgi:hypothetical protein